MIAHEAIFEMRRELITAGRGSREQDLLLETSAQIVTTELPRLTSDGRALVARWREQNLLDPRRAQTAFEEVTTELTRIGPEIAAALNRQRQIAEELRGLSG